MPDPVFNYWIAYRPGVTNATGNADDPWNGAPETTTRLGDYAKGMRLQSVGNAIVGGNVVDLPNPHIMQYLDSGSIVLFGNQTPSGSPLSAVEEDDSHNLLERDSLDTSIRKAIEEAMLLSFL
jgi:hypothetical protein